eukprot:Nk52_evm7s279 gene=Nk52_evmTU7s279
MRSNRNPTFPPSHSGGGHGRGILDQPGYEGTSINRGTRHAHFEAPGPGQGGAQGGLYPYGQESGMGGGQGGVSGPYNYPPPMGMMGGHFQGTQQMGGGGGGMGGPRGMSARSKHKPVSITELIEKDNVEEIKYLLEKGRVSERLLLHRVTKQGEKYFQLSAMHGSVKCLRFFVQIGVDVNEVGRNGHTALFTAAGSGNAECVDVLLSSFADTSVRDFNEATALHAAVCSRSLPIVHMLVEDGADIEAETRAGFTPFFAAVSLMWEEGVRYFIEKGCNVNHRTIDYKNALFYCRYDTSDCKMLNLLLNAGIYPLSDDNEPQSICVKYIDCLLEERGDESDEGGSSDTAAVGGSGRNNHNNGPRGIGARMNSTTVLDTSTATTSSGGAVMDRGGDGSEDDLNRSTSVMSVSANGANPFRPHSTKWLKKLKEYEKHCFPMSLKRLARLKVCQVYPFYKQIEEVEEEEEEEVCKQLQTSMTLSENTNEAAQLPDSPMTVPSVIRKRGIDLNSIPADIVKYVASF